MRYAIYETATGQIRQINATPHSAEIQAILPAGCWYEQVSDDVSDATHFIGESGPVPFPPKPAEYYEFDWATKTWFDPRTVQDARDAKWIEIKKDRQQAEFGGFTWDGSAFDSDALSQSRIQGAVQLAQLDPNFSIDWTLADNTTRTLDAADMVAVGVALGVHVNAVHAHGRLRRQQINDAKTIQEVEQIEW
ncbi:MAG: hypothetical protein CML16_04095 [Pusillimonas sp.]|nr:hypothetical protein [Pusillimonas sp.]MBC41811.1 hypothetical protein [Pusillimonas sp.]HCP76812.1 hypothetical protein [Pusillimonas sp.]|tara:strand:+ start:4815 stop:5390 length:576 start_codon:yes stop_codon:yes gene_type:complete